MAKDDWRDRLTDADWANWRAIYNRRVERDAREWAQSARNPNRSAAQALYPNLPSKDQSFSAKVRK